MLVFLSCKKASHLEFCWGQQRPDESADSQAGLGLCYLPMEFFFCYLARKYICCSDIGETDLLMVDGMVEQMGVHDLWEREGGTGLYPPPSFHVSLYFSFTGFRYNK